MSRRRRKQRNVFVRLVKHVLTDYDNKTFETGRVLGVLIVLAVLGFEGWDMYVNGAHFSVRDFGIGTGALLASIGLYLWGDAKGAPPEPVEPQAPAPTGGQ